jgi:hypothetical protein
MRSFALLLLGALVGCDASTGGARLTFAAAAVGTSAAKDGRLEFTNSLGYHVVLTRARLHVGALYLNKNVGLSGSQATTCILPGTYVGQVLGALDIDALSPNPQAFGIDGNGLAVGAKTGEVWFAGSDINTLDAPCDSSISRCVDGRTVILDVAGVADRKGATYTFSGTLTIGRNHLVPSADPAAPSLHPICRERIVSPIPVDLSPTAGTLLLRVDPSAWFVGVDFSKIPESPDAPSQLQFSDSSDNRADTSLYQGLHSQSAYQFEFLPKGADLSPQ